MNNPSGCRVWREVLSLVHSRVVGRTGSVLFVAEIPNEHFGKMHVLLIQSVRNDLQGSGRSCEIKLGRKRRQTHTNKPLEPFGVYFSNCPSLCTYQHGCIKLCPFFLGSSLSSSSDCCKSCSEYGHLERYYDVFFILYGTRKGRRNSSSFS